jgi:hypothetical protein
MIIAGTYIDGSPTYVGIGDNTVCASNQAHCPGRMSVKNPTIFMSCAGGEVRQTTNLMYLVAHPKYVWVPANRTTSSFVPNSLFLSYFRVGRVNTSAIINGVNKSFTDVGKIWPGTVGLQYSKLSVNTYESNNYDVLACT